MIFKWNGVTKCREEQENGIGLTGTAEDSLPKVKSLRQKKKRKKYDQQLFELRKIITFLHLVYIDIVGIASNFTESIEGLMELSKCIFQVF